MPFAIFTQMWRSPHHRKISDRLASSALSKPLDLGILLEMSFVISAF
jgi:hypothetical protein